MPYYRRVGEVPRKRHTVHRPAVADGAICPEELMGQEGFSGSSSLLYHRRSPSAVMRIERGPSPAMSFHANDPLRPHHLRTPRLAATTPGGVVALGDVATSVGGSVPGGDAAAGRDTDTVRNRHPLLAGQGVELAVAFADTTSPLYRNAIGDELCYVQSGSGVVESVFGTLPVGAGDYVVIPASTTHRWVVEQPLELLIIATRGHVRVPGHYVNTAGQLVEGAPFSERDIRGPGDEPLLAEGEDVPVLVRTRSGLSVHVHATHPFDVIGWDGCLYPWAFDIADFEPIVGRIHQPPSVHQTFAGDGFVVCSFVPRLYDTDPDAVKIPYHHANVDTDEVIYYSRGDFMSRAGAGIGLGSITLHPAGHVHGPQPGSYERSVDATRTEETAVMIDVFSPLALSDDALSVSDPDYVRSWG